MPPFFKKSGKSSNSDSSGAKNSALLAAAQSSSGQIHIQPERRRRSDQRMPRWYKPKREELPPEDLEIDLDKSLADYGRLQASGLLKLPSKPDVIGALPRREVELADHHLNHLMMEPEETFEASILHALSRLFVWNLGILYFYSGILFDKLLRRDSIERRAKRLLRTIQRIGGTAIKIGQQIAMRVDLLPYEYCAQLSKLLDKMPAMPLNDALAAIQRSTGKKLKEVFARFDPEPIGCASIACVYQAVLHSGEKVAVKVRRPGIGRAFAADLRALRWLIGIIEWLAIIRPGNMRNLAIEMEDTFMEELDLRLEAYHQEIFRRNAQNPKLTKRFFFSAPRVFFAYTSKEVIVQDFVSGMWLGELLAAVEQGKPQALSRMRELKIDPKIVARRLMWISLWGNLSNTMFHADPHPANVIIQENNHIILIDFGACGHLQRDKRNRLQEFMRHRERRNVTGMVKAAMALLEPLPPIDLTELSRSMERMYYKIEAPVWSQQGRWWERTSATLWLGLMQISRKFNLPIASDTVRGLRATLLYDTLAARLDSELRPTRLSRRFLRDSLSLTGKRMRKSVRKRVQRGLRLSDYAKLEELFHLGSGAFSGIQRFLDNPPFSFSTSIEKPIYAVITLLRVAIFLVLMLLCGAAALGSIEFAKGAQVAIGAVFHQVLFSRPFIILTILASLVGLRRIMFRFGDRDV